MKRSKKKLQGDSTFRMMLAAIAWVAGRAWRANRLLCVLLLIFAGLNALIPAALTILLGVMIGTFKSGDPTTLAGGMSLWIGIAVGLLFASAVSVALKRYCQLRLGDELHLHISQEILAHAATLDLPQFEDSDFQDQFSRASKNPGRACLNFLLQTINIGSNAVQMLSLFCVLLWVEPWLSWLLMGLGLPVFLIQWRIAKLRHELHRKKTTKNRWNRYYNSQLTNEKQIASTKMLRLAPLMLSRHEDTMRDCMDTVRATYSTEAVGTSVASGVYFVGFLVAVLVVANRAVTGTIGLGVFVIYWTAAMRFRTTMTTLFGSLAEELETGLALQHIVEFLKIKPAIVETKALAPPSCRGAVEFKNVSFGYPGSADLVLRDVSFRIEPGEMVALVGHNGAGKSTLAKLLSRLYDVNGGSVTIDGHDLRDLSLDFVRRNIAFVMQRAVQYEGTVLENLAYGDWERLLDQPDAVRRLATDAGVDEMILKMPQQYDTLLGRMFGSYDLSGGQWQRLSVARALASPAPVVILDEPTASLDAEAENGLRQQIRQMIGNRSTLLISHRFSTLGVADRIVVLEDGRVVEQGTHQELIRRGGLYSNLWKRHVSNTPQDTAEDLRLAS